MTVAAPPLRWHEVSEKGGAFAIRLLVAISTALGRRAGRIVLYAVAAWFVLLHPGVRRTSRDYLARMGLPSGLGGVYRHVLFFARVSLDRVFLAKGELGRFRLSFHGEEHLHAAARSGRGALVLVAHVGSFEVLRALAGPRDVPLHVLAYFRNARRITAALRALDPALEARVIAIRPEDPSFVLQAEEVVRRGEILATMADRIGPDGKSVTAPFLGAPARFPSGPWLLAAALGCPVLVGFGLHTPPDRYDLHCEPLADRVELPRGRRDAALAEWAARYAAVLERTVRLSPYNWFNFYDFWSAE